MKPVRYGMIGGGQGAFIGVSTARRRRLPEIGRWPLGRCLQRPRKPRHRAPNLALPADRTYGSWAEMLEREAALPADVRIEAVSIVTPNHMHAPPAIAALEAGYDVVIDKPLADTLENAQLIADAVARTGRRIAVTHTYTGYPLVKQAREMIASGETWAKSAG